MSASIHTPVTVDRLTFAWPDGTIVLDALSGSFGAGRTGLVGRNGAGKSTLLRLIAAELQPTAGHVIVSGDVAYLPQRLTLDTHRRVAELLGIAAPLDAVRAISAGDVDPIRFDAVGDDWDIEARAEAALAEAGLEPSFLDRTVGELSGGEAVLVGIAGIRLRRAPITLLDEPTNNLDREARARLREMVRTWRGTLVVVSHDVVLLELMDDTAELYGSELNVFGGPYSAWRTWLDTEQDAARQAAVAAAQSLKREKRQRIEAETKLAHRASYAKKDFENKRRPKIIMKLRAQEAQVSAGRLRTEVAAKEESARRAHETADERVRDDESMRIALPDPDVSRSRRIATLGDGIRSWVIQGPERVALVGANGVGKTTLVRHLVASAAHDAADLMADPSSDPLADGTAADDSGSHPVRLDGILRSCAPHTARIGYLSQRGDGLDEAASVLANVSAAAAHIPDRALRNQLARFLIRGATVDRAVAALSGGERFRVALAKLLLTDPAPQLVVLDEPTNNLDLDTVDQLVEVIGSYQGAVLIVSHDGAFLARLEPDLSLELRADGELREV